MRLFPVTLPVAAWCLLAVVGQVVEAGIGKSDVETDVRVVRFPEDRSVGRVFVGVRPIRI